MNQASPSHTAHDIGVTITHIDGPLEGRTQTFTQPRISIGRDSSNDIVFPPGFRPISRHHAELIREGDQYVFISLGKNSCLMNQTALDRAQISDGDTIWLTQKGPKLQFHLPQTTTADVSTMTHPAYHEQQKRTAEFSFQVDGKSTHLRQNLVRIGADKRADIQLPVTGLSALQAEIIYREDAFFIRDISAKGSTLVNGETAHPELLLKQNDVVTLGSNKLALRFLGTGRFVEETNPHPELDTTIFGAFDTDDSAPSQKKGMTFFKSFIQRLRS